MLEKKKIGEKEKIWTYPYSGLDWTDWILLKKRVLLEHLAVLKTSTYHTLPPLPRRFYGNSSNFGGTDVPYLGAMSLPCCMRLPQLCQKQLCRVNSFSSSSGSSSQGCGFSHSKGVSLRKEDFYAFPGIALKNGIFWNFSQMTDVTSHQYVNHVLAPKMNLAY